METKLFFQLLNVSVRAYHHEESYIYESDLQILQKMTIRQSTSTGNGT